MSYGDSATPLAIAHRGGAGLGPENTLATFGIASALGFQYLETDVRLTRDGHVVCFHDSTLDRATDGRGRVRHHRLADLKALRVGGQEPIPTLAPDLAVEVLSESNTKAEIDQKLQEYFQSGTRLAWIIDPSTRSVAVYREAGDPARVLTESETLDGEQVLPGFTLSVAELFRNVPR